MLRPFAYASCQKHPSFDHVFGMASCLECWLIPPLLFSLLSSITVCTSLVEASTHNPVCCRRLSASSAASKRRLPWVQQLAALGQTCHVPRWLLWCLLHLLQQGQVPYSQVLKPQELLDQPSCALQQVHCLELSQAGQVQGCWVSHVHLQPLGVGWQASCLSSSSSRVLRAGVQGRGYHLWQACCSQHSHQQQQVFNSPRRMEPLPQQCSCPTWRVSVELLKQQVQPLEHQQLRWMLSSGQGHLEWGSQCLGTH
jgi:hypothetical protein